MRYSALALVIAVGCTEDKAPSGDPAFEPPDGAVEWKTSDGGNGHYYLAVVASDGISWTRARDAAAALGGHLVTFDNADELGFVETLIQHDALWDGRAADAAGYQFGPWVGAYQLTGATEPEGGWRWISDEPWTYAPWRSQNVPDAQPNNSGGDEHYAHFMGIDGREALLNDAPDEPSFTVAGYVVEFDVGTLPRPAPHPDATQWSDGNGHWYAVFSQTDPIDWTDAYNAARDLGGHLATSTSVEEQAFIYSLMENDDAAWGGAAADAVDYQFGPWLGGRQLDTSEEPAGNWTWLTGEPWSFEAWRQAPLPDPQPNNAGGDENYLAHMAIDGRENLWNDAPDASGFTRSYVVEFGPFPED